MIRKSGNRFSEEIMLKTKSVGRREGFPQRPYRKMGGSVMSQSGNSETPKIKSRISAILRATSGNFLEQFDFFLFGFYASAIAKAFFPSDDETAALLNTFGVFWLGALMRPIGAVVLGAYIDRIGRRKGLIVTLAIMAIGTVVIAFC